MSAREAERLARRAAGGDLASARVLVRLLESGDEPDPYADPVGWIAWQQAQGRLRPAALRAVRVAKFAEGYEDVVDRVARSLLSEWQADHKGQWPADASEVGTPDSFRREFMAEVGSAARTLGQSLDEVFDLPSRDEGSCEDIGQSVARAIGFQSREALSASAADVRRRIAELVAAGPPPPRQRGD